jgi:N6-L-threonylcarbamoyladenine synthase
MKLLLSIESTCDETAAAVIAEDLSVRSSVVATQHDLHARFGGVVPEIASRAHVERVLPVIHAALEQAGAELEDLEAIAVAYRPGLAGSLLVGLTAAKSLCVALGIPLIAIDHLQAHVYACRMAAGRDVFPCVGMVVSGGHTNLYRCATALDFAPLGGTIDDAAGEAFDKIASLLGLGFPGGPALERAARNGDPRRFRLPRPLLDDPQRIAFSFSGLKTAVRYEVFGPGKLPTVPPPIDAQLAADLAAAAQQAVVDCLVGKAALALEITGFRRLCLGGGVAANREFRQRLAALAAEQRVELIVAPPELCTDNAAMGAIAVEKWRAGQFAPLDLDIEAGLDRI